MKHLKHLFTVLLLLCTTVATAHDFEVGGIYYNILSETDKTVEVTFKGTEYSEYFEYSGSVVIPQSVTYNGSTYSVTSIGFYAFYDCGGLTSVTIPNSVTSFGYQAFLGCSGLTSITIPNSVISIGDEAFYGCKGLKTVYNFSNLTFSKGSYSNGWVAYYTDKVYNAPNGFIDGDFIWYENGDGMTLAGYLGNATELALPADYNGKSVTSIGDYAFNGCTGLTSIEIPNSVTSIGEYVFCSCTGLTSIEIPNSVTSIGYYAFQYCTGLTSITIPNSVISIGEWAFYGCTGLKTIINFSNLTFSKGSREYGYVACYADKVYNAPNGFIDGDFIWYENEDGMILAGYLGNATELALPADYNGKSVTSIGDEVFRGCTGLTNITIPNSVTSIGDDAFYGCTGLTSITIPNSVTSIVYRAFYGCTGLTSVVIGNSVTSIGYRAFDGCTGLTSITIPNSVTSIEDYAFQYCSGLKTVYNFSNLTFSKGSSSNGYVARYADKVYNAPNGSIEGDFIFGKPNDVNTLVGYLGNATELTLPAGYNGENYAIGAAAFQNYTGLAAELIIHNNITGIGASAFKGCNNIEKLYIGSSVESIGDKAFAGCEKITEIKVALEKPIKGSDDIFANAVYDNATLYIPNGTKSLYEKREPWNIFFDIVEIDFTGIEDVYDEVEADGEKVQTIYDLQGRKVEVPSEGLYIINGKKVMIK